MARIIRDDAGPPTEKRGNAVWVECERCRTGFPVSPAMLRPEAPAACCPVCHHEFPLATPLAR